MMENEHVGRYHNLLAREFESRIVQEPQSIVLDVRTPNEFDCGYIPNALNINIMDNSFYDAITRLDKTKTYFVYCRSGGRSGQACLLMAEQGFTVYNLMGGIGSWTGKVVTP